MQKQIRDKTVELKIFNKSSPCVINDRREVSALIESELGSGSIGKWMGSYKPMTYNSNLLQDLLVQK